MISNARNVILLNNVIQVITKRYVTSRTWVVKGKRGSNKI